MILFRIRYHDLLKEKGFDGVDEDGRFGIFSSMLVSRSSISSTMRWYSGSYIGFTNGLLSLRENSHDSRFCVLTTSFCTIGEKFMGISEKKVSKYIKLTTLASTSFKLCVMCIFMLNLTDGECVIMYYHTFIIYSI